MGIALSPLTPGVVVDQSKEVTAHKRNNVRLASGLGDKVRGGLRRVFTLFCAIVFLLVGVLHANVHVEFSSGDEVYTTSIDGPLDGTPKASVHIAHCHACSMIALETVPPQLPPIEPAAKHGPATSGFMSSATPRADTPPPKRLG